MVERLEREREKCNSMDYMSEGKMRKEKNTHFHALYEAVSEIPSLGVAAVMWGDDHRSFVFLKLHKNADERNQRRYINWRTTTSMTKTSKM